MGTACERAEALARVENWPAADVTRLVLAVGEAVGNAIEHGDPSAAEVEVEFREGDGGLDICVSDGGPGPDPTVLERPSLPDDPLAVDGRGLFILSTVTDAMYIDGGALCLTIRPRP
ncbi:ATP-binding protein [Rubrivirga sp. IMCC45206]|uniref:ATP-binding protein n=1 Tax=Rubrivirga sp. IMCC45206 TaxID=3391614 RepID=UPI00398FF710